MRISRDGDEGFQPRAAQEQSQETTREPGIGMETVMSTSTDNKDAHLDWRDLARRIEGEKDANKVAELARQLVDALEAERCRETPRQDGSKDESTSKGHS